LTSFYALTASVTWKTLESLQLIRKTLTLNTKNMKTLESLQLIRKTLTLNTEDSVKIKFKITATLGSHSIN